MYGGYGAPAPRPRWPWIVLGAFLGLVVLVVVLLWVEVSGNFGRPAHPFLGLWGGFLLLFLLLWVGFFLVRVAFWSARRSARYRTGPHGDGHGPSSAVEIARQRYARGEITREQFDQIMTDLTRRRVPP